MSPRTVQNISDGDASGDVLESLLGDRILGRDDHLDAPAIRIRADDVQAVLSTLRTEAGLDHCACVTAQEYDHRYETIYHLRSYDDPEAGVNVVVPAPSDDPTVQSATPVYRTADWHEREAYDLVGVEYEGHPDLSRILLPETWQGHPLSRGYDQNRPQIVSYTENPNPLAGADRDRLATVTGGDDDTADTDGAGGTDTMLLNIGPHHPATHGVLHVEVTMDGEQVIDVEPDIGYIHRCEEQMCQQGTYRHQIMPYPDRWDWGGGGLLNEWAYARVAETLADVEVPEYAQVIRTMAAELSRCLSHFLAVGAYALDVVGDFTASFMYAITDRERVQDILEDLTGQRLMFNYFRVGGVVWDLPAPREEFLQKVREFTALLPRRLEEYHDLLTGNEILQVRTVDTGELPPAEARQYGCTGPVARGSGIRYDVRDREGYGYYDRLDWDVVTEGGCDNFARLLVRLRELEQSGRIIEQCVDLLADWPAADREVQANVPRTIKPPADAEVYRSVEAAKGELGIYVRSDGTDTPARFKIRGPSFSNLQALPEMAEGGYLPDLIASIGSIDAIMGEVDR
jgi:NADH-quinone oxidoreductase subunit C/D